MHRLDVAASVFKHCIASPVSVCFLHSSNFIKVYKHKPRLVDRLVKRTFPVPHHPPDPDMRVRVLFFSRWKLLPINYLLLLDGSDALFARARQTQMRDKSVATLTRRKVEVTPPNRVQFRDQLTPFESGRVINLKLCNFLPVIQEDKLQHNYYQVKTAVCRFIGGQTDCGDDATPQRRETGL